MNITDNLFAGKLVRLAAPKNDDHELMAKWSDNVEGGRMGEIFPTKPTSAEDWEQFDQHLKKAHHVVNFRIRTLEDDKLIGFMVLNLSFVNQVAQFGIGIGDSAYWSRGYGSDAMRLGVNYAFRELGMYKVVLGVFSYNPRAIRSYEKVGFVAEARQRAMLYRDGEYHDMIEMGILRPEWEARLNEENHEHNG